MTDTPQAVLRVAVFAETDALRSSLRRFLERNGVSVIFDLPLREWQPGQIAEAGLDVLLVDLDEALDEDLARLDQLIDASPVPIMFNMTEGGLDRDYGDRLIDKLRRLAGTRGEAGQARKRNQEEAGMVFGKSGVVNLPQRPRPDLRVVDPAGRGNAVPADTVWVLGGSLGGPRAVRRFLAALPPDLPVGFVLVQHIAASYVPLLARQLDRECRFLVSPARHGEVLAGQQVVVVPKQERFSMTDGGVVELLPERRTGSYSPSINSVMAAVSRRYGSRSGAIIFSGMGNDGASACREMTDNGGHVWVQDPGTCLMASMPEAARDTGTVGFAGGPEDLAARLVDHVASVPARQLS